MAAGSGAIRAGRAFVELFTENSQLVRGLKTGERSVEAFGKKVFAIGAGINAGGAAMMAPIVLAARHFMTAGDGLDKMASRTGMAVEDLSSLGYAAETAGVSSEGFELSLRGMQKTLAAAAGGSSEALSELHKLGLSIGQLSAMSQDDQFRLLADRIGRIPHPANRAVLALGIFGKQGAALLPLLNKGAGGIRNLEQEAYKLGITMSGDQAAAAAKLGDAWGRIKAQLKAVSIQIGAALAPLLTELANSATRYVRVAIDWIRAHRGLISSTFTLVAALTYFGAALTSVGVGLIAATYAMSPLIAAVSLLGRGLGVGLIAGGRMLRFLTVESRVLLRYLGRLLGPVLKAGIALFTAGFAAAAAALKTGFAAVLTPIGLLTAALVGLGAYLVAQSGVIQAVLGNLSGAFHAIKDDALIAFQGIADALASGDMKLALAIGLTSVQMVWTRFINSLESSWLGFKKFFLDVWANASHSLSVAILEVTSGFKKAWVNSISFVEGAIGDFQRAAAKTALAFMLDGSDLEDALGIIDEQADQKEEERIARREQQVKQIDEDRSSNLSNNRDAFVTENDSREKRFNDDIALQQESLNRIIEKRKKLLDEAAKKRKEVERGQGGQAGSGDAAFDIDALASKARHAGKIADLADFERGSRKGIDLALSALGASPQEDESVKLLSSIKTNTRDMVAVQKSAPQIAAGSLS